jgi:diguanylate cyclase (GGDEF)-like protein/PAS domain S-box-containing protein
MGGNTMNLNLTAVSSPQEPGDTFFRNIFDSTDVHQVIVGPDGIIRAANAAWLRFAQENSGTEKVLCDVGDNYFVPVDEQSEDAKQAADAFEGVRKVQLGELPVFSLEYPCHGPGDNQRWFILKALPVQGNPGTVMVSHTNITDLKQVELRLQKSEADLRAIFDNSIESFMVIDRSRTIQAFNAIACQWAKGIFKRSMQSGDSIYQYVLPQDRERFDQNFQLALDGESVLVEKKFPIANIEHHYEFHYVPVRAADGQVSGVFFSTMDITDRKLAEQALLRSEERLHLMLRGSHDAPWDWDLLNNQIYYSPNWWAILGYEVDELPADTGLWTRLMHPDDQPRVRNVFGEVLDGISDQYEIEFRLCHKDGHYVPLLSRGIILRNALGTAVRVSGTNSDLTERKRAEEALRASETRLRLILEGSQDIVVMLSLDGTYLYYNAPAKFGISAADILGKTPFDMFPVSIATNIMARLQQVAKSGQSMHVETPIPWMGETIWYNDRLFPILGQDGTTIGVGIVSRDITERKRVEEILRESEQRYRLLANHASDVIWTMGLDGKFTYISPSIFQMRGFTPEEALQHSLEQTASPGSLLTLQHGLNNVLSGIKNGKWQPVEYFEVEQPCKDGMTIWTETTARLMYDENGKQIGLVGTSRNITERKLLQEKLRQQATTDELTGIANRRYFLDAGQTELKRSLRLQRMLSIVLIDIDRFKSINDTFGHAAGDQVLIAFSQECLKHIRTMDLFARIGGDEFTILLPETDLAQACEVVERVRVALAAMQLNLNGKLVTLSLSAGISCLQGGHESLDSLLGRADRALYKAKEGGRGRVEIGTV